MTLPGPRTASDPAALPSFDGATPIVDVPRRAFVEQVMGLPMSVHVRGPLARGPEVARAVDGLFADLRADDMTFSTWKPDSPVSRVRRGDLDPADAGPRFAEVVRLCEEAALRTDGAFDAWLPGPSPAERAAGAGPADGERRFDPTGLVKGWAAERAFEGLLRRLEALGPHDALLSAGGDVVVACTRTDTPDWVVAVEDPRDRTRTLLSVPLRRGAVATSGTAARGAHLLDPATGGPAASGLLSATVVGPSLVWADVYATAAFVKGADAAAWLAGLAQHVGVLVDAAGGVRTVTGS